MSETATQEACRVPGENRHWNRRTTYPIAFLLAWTALAMLAFHESSYPSRLGADRAGRTPDIRLGREIYIAEGCIHCHTQYARPGTRDEVQWGPAAKPGQVLGQEPPLIGNRRQGPDLMNVGNRRSPEWQRAHLMNPRALIPASRMPSYEHLFTHGGVRGEALVAFLCSLGADTAELRAKEIAQWAPAPQSRPNAKSGAALYHANCANCHGENGSGDGPLADIFGGRSRCRLTDLAAPLEKDPSARLARIIKFGIPGTQMPGYETLTDSDALGLADFVASLREKRDPQ